MRKIMACGLLSSIVTVRKENGVPTRREALTGGSRLFTLHRFCPLDRQWPIDLDKDDRAIGIGSLSSHVLVLPCRFCSSKSKKSVRVDDVSISQLSRMDMLSSWLKLLSNGLLIRR